MKDILIVEDGADERERLEALFIEAGYSVISSEGVEPAEKFLKLHSFRLVILDIGLNDRSGSYLFSNIRSWSPQARIIIFTGNPSAHLKQRFIEGGAEDYIVKGSPQARGDLLLARVKQLLGAAEEISQEGIDLEKFLALYVTPESKEFFLDTENNIPSCKDCGESSYQVLFSHQTQMPSQLKGRVVCANCGREFDDDLC